MGWPRGPRARTLTIAHITFTMAYVAVIVQSSFSDMDASLEEATMGLGAKTSRGIFRYHTADRCTCIGFGMVVGFHSFR